MRSVTELPLDGGRAPRWLIHRMVSLGRAIGNVIIDEYGADEFLARICDRDWFQAPPRPEIRLAQQWHETVTMGALKEALNGSGENDIAGGKGKAGTNTPNDIITGTDSLSIRNRSEAFTENSRLAAKIDAGLVYDDIGIHHHTFNFTRTGRWDSGSRR